MAIYIGAEATVPDWSVKMLLMNEIMGSSNLQLLYLDYDLINSDVVVKDVTGGSRTAIYACPVVVSGQNLVQFRVYNVGSALIPSNCALKETMTVTGF